MNSATTTDHRSQELMQRIYDRIDLTAGVIFTNLCIEIPYRINGKLREIKLSTPWDIAAFAHHNYIISRYEKTPKGVRMYEMQILPALDRRGYPYQYETEVLVKRMPTMFSKDEIKWMVARYEYDFGDINDFWNDLFGQKGTVLELYPQNNDSKPSKRTA